SARADADKRKRRKRRRIVVATAIAVVTLTATGVIGYAIEKNGTASKPAESVSPLTEISANSSGHVIRVGPYLYCNLSNPDDCQTPQTQGELPVNGHDPVQLSVPEAISRASWRLLQVYEDPNNTTTTTFQPNSQRAVTIATVDPQRGQLKGIVVQ